MLLQAASASQSLKLFQPLLLLVYISAEVLLTGSSADSDTPSSQRDTKKDSRLDRRAPAVCLGDAGRRGSNEYPTVPQMAGLRLNVSESNT